MAKDIVNTIKEAEAQAQELLEKAKVRAETIGAETESKIASEWAEFEKSQSAETDRAVDAAKAKARGVSDEANKALERECAELRAELEEKIPAGVELAVKRILEGA